MDGTIVDAAAEKRRLITARKEYAVAVDEAIEKMGFSSLRAFQMKLRSLYIKKNPDATSAPFSATKLALMRKGDALLPRDMHQQLIDYVDFYNRTHSEDEHISREKLDALAPVAMEDMRGTQIQCTATNEHDHKGLRAQRIELMAEIDHIRTQFGKDDAEFAEMIGVDSADLLAWREGDGHISRMQLNRLAKPVDEHNTEVRRQNAAKASAKKGSHVAAPINLVWDVRNPEKSTRTLEGNAPKTREGGLKALTLLPLYKEIDVLDGIAIRRGSGMSR